MLNVPKQASAAPLPAQDGWFYRFGRILIAALLLALSAAFDVSVLEGAADNRWLLTHWTAAILLAAFFISRLGRRNNEIPLRVPLIIWPAAFLAVWSALSMLWTVNPYNGWWFLKHFLSYVTVFAFVYILRDERWYVTLLWLVGLGVAFNSCLVIAQLNVNNITDEALAKIFPGWNAVMAGFSALLRVLHFPDRFDREIFETLPFVNGNMFIEHFIQANPPGGTLSNKNLVASYLVLATPGLFYLFLAGRSIFARIAAAFLLALSVQGLMSTQSRAGWLSAICGALFLIGLLVLHREYRRTVMALITKKVLVLMALACAAAIFGAVKVARAGGFDRFVSVIRSPSGEITVGPRVAYSLNSLAILRDNPFLGVGIGSWFAVYPAYHQAIVPTPERDFSMARRPQDMHNDLLQAFVELGIFGGLAYIGVFLALLAMTWRIGNSPGNGKQCLLAPCLMTGIVALGINSLMDFPLQFAMAPVLLWVFAGMLTGLYVMRAGYAKGLPGKIIPVPRVVFALAAVAAVAFGLFVFRDDWMRRRGEQYLKLAYMRADSGQFDAQTLQYLRKSMGFYTWNVLLQSCRAWIYGKYDDSNSPMNTDEKIREIEAAIKYNPYSLNDTFILGWLYFMKAWQLYSDKDRAAESIEYADKTVALFKAMLDYPGMPAGMNYTLGGMAYLLKGMLQPSDADVYLLQAEELFEKALELNPDDESARGALEETRGLLAGQRRVER